MNTNKIESFATFIDNIDSTNTTIDNQIVDNATKVRALLKDLIEAIRSIDISSIDLKSSLKNSSSKESYDRLRRFQKAVERSLNIELDNYVEGQDVPKDVLDYSKTDPKLLDDIMYNFTVLKDSIGKEVKKISEEKSYDDKYNKIYGLALEYIKSTNSALDSCTDKIVEIEDIIVRKHKNLKDSYEKVYNGEDITVHKGEAPQYAYRVSLGKTSKISVPEIESFKTATIDIANLYQDRSYEKIKDDSFVKIEDILKLTPKTKTVNIVGGAIERARVNEVNNRLIDMSQKIEKLNIELHSLKKVLDEYNFMRRSKNMFLIYCFTIYMKVEKRITSEMIMYRYINKGILQFYSSIIKNILLRIKNGTENRYKKIIKYLNEYHYFTLETLNSFLDFVLKNLHTTDVVDIFNCKGDVKYMFMLLNEFKDILESYNEFAQKRVTVYARINDWNKGFTRPDKVFLSKDDDDTVLVADQEKCKTTEEKSKIETVFTEVYDTEKFVNNEVISKYMSLETQIAKGKGVMMMTYGYSGVGKTATLFGNENMQGVLQSTLSNIRDMKSLSIRVYEIYGRGTEYSFYWKGTDLDHKLIHHTLGLSELTLQTIGETEIKDHKAIMNYIKENRYETYDTRTAEEFLKRFSDFVKQLDSKRKESGRITRTPNNPESSRSVIVYDMFVEIEKDNSSKKVPFVIIDLPGREEILETYVDTYTKRYFVQDTFRNDIELLKMFLSSVSLNPLGLAVMCSGDIYEFANSLSREDRRSLFGSKMYEEAFITREGKKYTEGGERYLYEETVRLVQEKGVWRVQRLGDIMDFTDFNKSYKFNLMGQTGNSLRDVGAYVQLKNNQTENRYLQSMCSLFVLRRLILNKRLDLLIQLNKKLIDRYVNDKLRDFKDRITDKRDFAIAQMIDQTKDYKTVKNENPDIFRSYDIDEQIDIDALVDYNYIDTPFEGVYINENINGLVKYLSSLVNDNTSNIIEKQSDELDFTKQKRLIADRIKKDTDNSTLSELYDELKKDYSSGKLYRYENPFMEDILKHYKEHNVSEYKVFYLFSNNSLEFKCKHQIELLKKTESFIRALKN